MKKAYELPEMKIEIIHWTNDIITESQPLVDDGIKSETPGIDAGGDF